MGYLAQLGPTFFDGTGFRWGAQTCTESATPMNPEQLNVLTLAVTVLSSGSSGVYSVEVLEKLRLASGLHHQYGRECAQAVLIDAIARRGFFSETGTNRPDR
jgi:hypothetical protein